MTFISYQTFHLADLLFPNREEQQCLWVMLLRFESFTE